MLACLHLFSPAELVDFLLVGFGFFVEDGNTDSSLRLLLGGGVALMLLMLLCG